MKLVDVVAVCQVGLLWDGSFYTLYEGQSISFRIDDVKHRKLSLDVRGRHHLQSSPLLRLDNNPSSAVTF